MQLLNSAYYKWCVLMSVGIMIMLLNLDMTIVNLALAEIAHWFSASLLQTQWVIAAYLLSTTVFFIVFGKLADIFGKRFIFLLGIFIFTLASFLAGISTNIWMLIAARFVQGFGFAATLGLSIVLIVGAFPKEQRGFAAGMAVLISGISQAMGPVLGGIILERLSWQWIFLMNIPLGFLSFLLTLYLIPKDVSPLKKQTFDFFATLSMIVGLSIILISLNQLALLPSSVFFACIGFGILLLYLFYKNCLSSTQPLINADLFRNYGYLKVIVIRMLFMFVMSSFFFILPLYLQNILGLTPFKAGMSLLMMTILVAIISPITGKILDRLGFKQPILISLICAAISCVASLPMQATFSLMTLTLNFIFLGLAIGMQIPASVSGVLNQIEEKHAGTAVGLFLTTAIAGSIAGVAISGFIISSHVHYFVMNYLVSHHLDLSFSSLDSLMSAASGTHNIISAQHLFANATQVAGDGFMSAFHRVAFLNLVLCIFSISLAVSLRPNKNNVSYNTGVVNSAHSSQKEVYSR